MNDATPINMFEVRSIALRNAVFMAKTSADVLAVAREFEAYLNGGQAMPVTAPEPFDPWGDITPAQVVAALAPVTSTPAAAPARAAKPAQPAPVANGAQRPSVPIAESVTREHIVCLECGSKKKTLARHIGSVHSLTPDAYRKKWGLPNDYPMTSIEYSERRSALALESGLGRKPGEAAQPSPTPPAAPPPPPPPPPAAPPPPAPPPPGQDALRAAIHALPSASAAPPDTWP